MNYTQYIQQFPEGKKVVLLTIDPDGTPYRISSARFSTLPTDATLPNKVFASMIRDGGVPRMHRALRDIWGGGAVSSWGPVGLSTWDYKSGSAGSVDFRSQNLYGKKAVIRLSGPNHLTPFSDALVILVGYLRRKSGTVGKGITLEIADRKSLLEKIVPTLRYKAADENAYFPVANDGKVKQIVLGKWNNCPCTLINKNTHTYEVSDRRFPVNDIVAVYNNGISVAFTKDLANNQFTLTAAPLSSGETITAKVEGVKHPVSGVLLTTLKQFMEWILDSLTDFDSATEASFDAGIPTDDAQYILASEESIADHLDAICKSILATWFLTPLDILQVKMINEPVPGGVNLNKKKYLNDISWEEEQDIYYKVPYRYDSNAAVLSEIANVPDADFAIWLKKPYKENIKEDAAILSAYPNATVAEPIQTFFLSKTPAEAVAQRALDLFGVQRYSANIKVPYISPAQTLLGSINLADADLMDGDCLITEITEDLVSATPILDIKVWK